MNNDSIPNRIFRLQEISKNLWWSWDPDGRDLFRLLDYHLWHKTKNNAIEILNMIKPERLEEVSQDPSFLKLYDKVIKKFDVYMDVSKKWYSKKYPSNSNDIIAYFSFEFGLHQSLPIYSGGLGVLAGDTCKEASDLGLPFVAVGFYYHQGYFDQIIPSHGWQEAKFNKIDFDKLPMDPVLNNNEKRLTIPVKIGNDTIYLQVWQVNVGTITLYLLDTDIEQNPPWYRGLSSRLYGGDQDMRINQELILGIGGVKLLKKLDINPAVWHLNEGHCSLLAIERIINYCSQGLEFNEALDLVKKTTVFTTHTPVPAGHDRFSIQMIEDKLKQKWDELNIDPHRIIQLGINPDGPDDHFNMTVLGINTSHLVNGVSSLHTDVTQVMWQKLFEQQQGNTNLQQITNGVHIPTFISGPMRRLFDKYIDSQWIEKQDDPNIWQRISDIPDEEFWDARSQDKQNLMSYVRETARDHRVRGEMDAEQILASGTFLDPHALTIGFARRFASYKRPDLIFRDMDQIRKIMNDPYEPVQFVFAGKAHPADESGKHMLQKVYNQALSKENGGRIAFIENYDIQVARFLVQGVDVWLNNPIRPHEASGTSGMKAAINGIPHFSTLDGWWAEGYNGSNGWAIGDGKEFKDKKQQNKHDVESLYEVLRNEIVSLFYKRDSDQIPRNWIKVAKESIKSVASQFSARRMLKEYVAKMYRPSIENNNEFKEKQVPQLD